MSDSTNPGQRRSLADYIQSNEYSRTVDLPENVIDGGEALRGALATGEESSAEVSNATDSAVQTEQIEGQTNPETPDPFAEKRREMELREREIAQREQEFHQSQEQIRVQQAQEALRREEAQFGRHLQTLETDAEKQAAIANFQRTRAIRERDFYKAEAERVQSETIQTREDIAKNQVIWTVMRTEGLPDEIAPFLQAAKTVEEFNVLVDNAKKLVAKFPKAETLTTAPNPLADAQARIDSGVDVAGGTRAGFVPPPEPKKNSGDLLGLMRSREYNVQNRMQGS